MSQTANRSGTHGRSGAGGGGAWAAGGTLFAGVLLLIDGILAVVNGIAAIADDDIYVRADNYAYTFSLTTWGWIHLVLGVIAVATGWGILRGAGWARVLGVVIASLSVVLNFIWLPYQPFWAVIAIGVGLYVIWALCTDRSIGTV
ncbi:hypothetical protein [Streptomyces sp. NBC_00829]|uniref:DUF7144 family membrane protein n=1 Tax=Streptomyces sp. NBC_00829 TaxID=2903679 RepID=UPI00386606A7|nr:hypothetical protein OG293_33615 [Streptomyces sp. NBC_00829]